MVGDNVFMCDICGRYVVWKLSAYSREWFWAHENTNMACKLAWLSDTDKRKIREFVNVK